MKLFLEARVSNWCSPDVGARVGVRVGNVHGILNHCMVIIGVVVGLDGDISCIGCIGGVDEFGCTGSVGSVADIGGIGYIGDIGGI